MTRSQPAVEKALEELQRLVRQPAPAEPVGGFTSGQVPEELATPEATWLYLPPDESEALEVLRWLLPEDLRFEYMDKGERTEATWRFVCDAHFTRDKSHVEDFVAKHAREPMELTCFFPVLLLAVSEASTLQGARLIPAADVDLPAAMLGPDPRTTMASVIAVECSGTDYVRMSVRAAEVARHALRLLRTGLREEHFLPDRQLRFTLGESYWFSDGIGGWAAKSDVGWPYEPDAGALERAIARPIASLPLVGSSDIERCANRALQWFEQAQLAVDPLMEVLLLTFALEAILGRKSGKLKARELALRRAVLACKVTGNFTHPARFYLIYDKVRSVAVHGGEPPPVDRELIDAVAWDVRRALNEFLEFAEAEGLVKRARVLDALDSDPGIPEIIERFMPDE
jgi:hypothetical protein